MTFTSRPYSGPADLARLAALAAAHPADQRHVADLPYRLASWALETPDDARLWTAADGQLAGFAVLQGPWGTLDLGLTPAARAGGLPAEMLAWGAARGAARARERGQPVDVYVELSPADADLAAAAEAAGFAAGAYEALRLELPLPAAHTGAAPEGLLVRPLRGEAECAAYVAAHRAAFGTANMTVAWRQRVLQAPAYAPDLDLVAEAAGGTLAGFCVGWLAPDGAWAQVEPLGVVPDFQRRGVGRALLAELFRRMAARGARTAVVEPYAGDEPAVRFYQSAGFTVTRCYQAHGRTCAPQT
ncbi:MAG: GNAT family N-acetyltransferase [Anaerolineales bacterium]|nr:GNAT family N-acetyltransferase [Anaerolineales bacterium]